MSQGAGGAAGGELDDYEALAGQAMTASTQQRREEAQELFGRAAVAAEQAGATVDAAVCYSNQADSLIGLE